MCGIVGIFDLHHPSLIDRDLLCRMNETQFHRGPDEGGIHIESGLGFGHRRLSIIDLSSGQQPLFNENGTVVVTFNGEIYNFSELARELSGMGHTFKTHSDTEVIVHAWEEWGEECVNRFRGMFAFAIWDRNKRSLFLARDRLGKKPLYYSILPGKKLVFGSELKSLLKHPGLLRDIDPEAVEDYFALGYVPEPKTIFKAVRKLPPAHTLLFTQGSCTVRTRQYWDIVFESNNNIKEEEAKEELLGRLKEAVNVRLMSEVSLGAFLSGGVDSSAIVSVMAELQPDEPVNTCSIGFGDAGYNETEFAEIVARRYATEHVTGFVDPDDFSLLDKLATLYDEPFADSSAIPTYRVCELAKKRVTVALSGDGGDENFAGYRRHRWHMNEEKIRQKIPASARSIIFGSLGHAYPKLDWAPKIFRAKSTLQALGKESFEAYLHSVSVIPDILRTRLFSKMFKNELAGYHAIEVFKHHAKRFSGNDPLSLIQYIDIKTYLPGDILVKVDRASMAHSLEVRVPILDHLFMEWVATLPSSLKLKGQEGKYIFKKALEAHLPHDILYRPKMGFGVPLASWFRGPLRQHVRSRLLGPVLESTNIFEMKVIRQLIDEHQSGIGEHSAALWSLLMFESSYRHSITM